MARVLMQQFPQEKVKKKMTSCLLGVTRDSVMRLDPDTKETLQKWPLTSLRRWSAAPNTFTMDFGDYSGLMNGLNVGLIM